MSTNNYLYNQQLSPYYRQKLLLRQQLLKQQQMRRLLNHRNQLNNGILNILITMIIFAQGYSLLLMVAQHCSILLKIAVITFSRKYWYYWRKCRANRFRTWYNWYQWADWKWNSKSSRTYCSSTLDEHFRKSKIFTKNVFALWCSQQVKYFPIHKQFISKKCRCRQIFQACLHH